MAGSATVVLVLVLALAGFAVCASAVVALTLANPPLPTSPPQFRTAAMTLAAAQIFATQSNCPAVLHFARVTQMGILQDLEPRIVAVIGKSVQEIKPVVTELMRRIQVAALRELAACPDDAWMASSPLFVRQSVKRAYGQLAGADMDAAANQFIVLFSPRRVTAAA